MIWVDYAILGIIGISVLVGALRGLIKEAFSLAVWVAAFLAAYQFSGGLAEMLDSYVTLPSARTALAFAGVFLAVLAVGGLLTFLAGKLVEKTGLSGTDRLLGGVFGTARGLILIVMLIMVAGFTPLPNDPWWEESGLLQSMLPLAETAAELLPESISQYLDFHPEAEAVETKA
ncbi:MAG: CvpA family protein [Xanthomonadales bacterium]|nr:CvpA family protein [Xanthomonadales bacterium]NNL94205.1 CvpA family protein [Xanthomonadales bacterium]